MFERSPFVDVLFLFSSSFSPCALDLCKALFRLKSKCCCFPCVMCHRCRGCKAGTGSCCLMNPSGCLRRSLLFPAWSFLVLLTL